MDNDAAVGEAGRSWVNWRIYKKPFPRSELVIIELKAWKELQQKNLANWQFQWKFFCIIQQFLDCISSSGGKGKEGENKPHRWQEWRNSTTLLYYSIILCREITSSTQHTWRVFILQNQFTVSMTAQATLKGFGFGLRLVGPFGQKKTRICMLVLPILGLFTFNFCKTFFFKCVASLYT